MSRKIVLVRREVLSHKEQEMINTLTLEQLVDYFGVMSVFQKKKVNQNFELPYFYLAMKKEGVLTYLDLQTAQWFDELKEPVSIDLPSMYHDGLIKDQMHFYFTNAFGYAYKISKHVFVKGLREMAEQLDFPEHKNLSDDEFIETSFFRDVLDQNFEIDVADNYYHLEALGHCDKDNIKEEILFKNEVASGLNEIRLCFGFQQDH